MATPRIKKIRPLSMVTHDGRQGRFHGFRTFGGCQNTGATVMMRVKVEGRWEYWPAPLRRPKPAHIRKPIDAITLEAQRQGIQRKSYVERLKRQRETGIPNHG